MCDFLFICTMFTRPEDSEERMRQESRDRNGRMRCEVFTQCGKNLTYVGYVRKQKAPCALKPYLDSWHNRAYLEQVRD